MRLALKLSVLWLATELGACDGRHEEAGEKADIAAGYTDSTASLRVGPAERAGEKQDKLEQKKK